MIECPPTARVEVVNVAVPVASRTPDPSSVTPSRKSTVPEGIPLDGATATTVAVKVTGWPAADGLVSLTSAVDDPPAPTDWGSSPEIEPVNDASPR